jgi:hypothetical protein
MYIIHVHIYVYNICVSLSLGAILPLVKMLRSQDLSVQRLRCVPVCVRECVRACCIYKVCLCWFVHIRLHLYLTEVALLYVFYLVRMLCVSVCVGVCV